MTRLAYQIMKNHSERNSGTEEEALLEKKKSKING
jgi:hypothetical protein